MESHTHHFNYLKALATDLAPVANAKVAAALVGKSGRIVSVGVNSYKTHPLQARYQYHCNPWRVYMHAELAALVKARSRLSGFEFSKSTLFVVRVKQSKFDKEVLTMSKPCEGCQTALASFRVSKVYYSGEDGGMYKL